MLKAGLTEQLGVQFDFVIHCSWMYGALAQYRARRATTKTTRNVCAILVRADGIGSLNIERRFPQWEKAASAPSDDY